MSLFPCIIPYDIANYERIGAIKCPFCLCDYKKSKIFKTKKGFLIHVSKHSEVPENQKRSVRYYASNYFTMLAGGMVS